MAAARQSVPAAIPPLESGDHLTRDEFHRRYELHPEIRRAELIEGVVYVSSPVGPRHGQPHLALGGWLAAHVARHPVLFGVDNATVLLDDRNEVQPDLSLFREAATRVAQSPYIAQPPDLAIEVAVSSASIDTHAKKEAYRRNGVQEYLVWRVLDGEVDWWELRDGEYVALPADAAGVIESRAFPGLRLDVRALLAGDLAAVLAALRGGDR